jgi:hypothetical protein
VLTNALVAAEPHITGRAKTASGGWRNHRKIWIGVGVAAAAFVVVAAVSSRGTPSTTAGVNAPQIGTPTIIIGKP